MAQSAEHATATERVQISIIRLSLFFEQSLGTQASCKQNGKTSLKATKITVALRV